MDKADDPHSSPSEGASDAAVAEATKNDPDAEFIASELHWYNNVYKGHGVPQFTFRAVLMGGLLGSALSISNLYTSIKLGWAFGVAITACVLSYVIWNSLRLVFRNLSPMTILENNCMQSTASAAGYSTGSTLATAFGAYLLITGTHIDPVTTFIWTLLTALLGVILAVPMKKQMINREKLAFPSGIAAAETLMSLYGGSIEAVKQARALMVALFVGAVTGIARTDWMKFIGLGAIEDVKLNIPFRGFNMAEFRGFAFEPSVLLPAAGMIVGMRVSASMLLGAVILYFGFGPWLVEQNIIAPKDIIKVWALWTGASMLVASGLTSFAVQWKTVMRAIGGAKAATQGSGVAELEKIEVPAKWFIIGAIPLGIALVILEYVAFKIAIPVGCISVVLSFFLALVACRSTGETDITPIGAMGKIAQLTFAVLARGDITANLMAASATANIASSSADLLTDLKSGYLLGANARQQFLAQLSGGFIGAVTVVPAWFLMIPTKEILEKYDPPSTQIYMAVAKALSKGISEVPETAQWGILIGGFIGISLALIDHFFPKARRFTPSAMGLGLSWVMPFQNALSFFIGAVIAAIWTKLSKKSADTYIIPVASGAIAGESLASAIYAIITAVTVMLPGKNPVK